MTYALFLALFLVPPILLLGARVLADRSRVRKGLLAIGALALVALLYTTPWDNYLVANRLWWYEPSRVSGLKIGWVPLEEYLFFMLQPLATGLWTLLVLHRFPPAGVGGRIQRSSGLVAAAALAAIWAAALLALVLELQVWRYLAPILIWALPPLALQFAYGGALLWGQRAAALLAVLPPTLYLAGADALAIRAGVWAINPAYSLGIRLLPSLPLEELLFFLLTNCLLAFSLLLLAPRLRLAPAREPSQSPIPSAPTTPL